MDTRMPNLVWLRTFEAAARLLNFTETGRQLGLTQTAVSQHIKGLESALGCQLFSRRPRNLELTDMGHAYVHTVRRSLADISLATNHLFGRSARQTITIRAPVSTATLWLAPQLPAFLTAHPGVNIKLVSTIWASALSDVDVDIDLRIGHGDWPGVQVEKISTETVVAISAQNNKKSIAAPADLLAQPLIQVLGHEENWSELLTRYNFNVNDASVRYQVDTTAIALALVSSGGGVASIMTRFADAAIEAGHRIQIISDPVQFSQSHYLTTRADDGEINPQIELVKSWLRSCFEI